MTKSARIAVAVALLLGGSSLAMAKTRGAAEAHRHPSHTVINETTPRRTPAEPSYPVINETTPRPTAADPSCRLSDQYYGYSDPYHGLFNFFAVQPHIPGYTYRQMRMPQR